MQQLRAFTFLFVLCTLIAETPSFSQIKAKPSLLPPDEVIYHVVQRSFFDSNGDRQGDLAGLTQKLDYLQELGVTTILMLPLYESSFYHNYFAGDFEKIDHEFGTMDDYLTLVKAVHRRGMKIYLDMETQYVTEEHLWYRDAVGNPASAYSDFLLFNGPGNTKPEPIVWDLTQLTGFDGTVKKVTTVNLKNKKVLDYNYTLFHYFMDPNNDGKFDDGADGFRLDHMMDVLDKKEKFNDLFKTFWTPLLGRLHKLNPKLVITAEQAEWASYGFDYFDKGGVDRVFAFRLLMGIASFDKHKIANAADTTFSMTPRNKQQVVFIENHDVQRFATTAKSDPGKLRAAASLNLLLGGVPAIYYGQELGMTGAGGYNKFGSTDANDIPQREAFEWYSLVEGTGMALWYKDTGPWWDQTNLKPNDGISLEEQKPDSASLWNYYRRLIAVRKHNASLISGSYRTLANDNEKVISFLRQKDSEMTIVVVNLSDTPQKVAIDLVANKLKIGNEKLELLFGNASVNPPGDQLTFSIPPYGTAVWKVK